MGERFRPSQLGPYRIIAPLGEGGMGVVYRATHVDTGQVVALKTARVPYGSEIAGLRSEIHALTRLRHPGVVQIADEGLDHDCPWYAMELLEGRTLDDYRVDLWRSVETAALKRSSAHESTAMASISDAETMPIVPHEPSPSAPPVATSAPSSIKFEVAAGRLDEVLTLVQRLCAPLAFLHGAGIVHRDLKPSNVFIRDDGTPVLMDFGLVARSVDAGGREVIEGSNELLGTAAYIAPEQILGQIVDARSDLYALGCILYELLTSRLPFDGEIAGDLLRRHLTETPLPPSSIVSGLPEALDALVLRLLSKDPRKRIGHADDLAAMLGAMRVSQDDPPVEVAASAYLYRPQLAGREEAVSTFKEHLLAARGGMGRCVLVGGESGVGKTYLAAAIAREAVQRGVQVVTGECVPVATPDAGTRDVRGAPLHPFRRLLEAIADRCRERGLEATDRILGARGKVLATYAPLLRHLPGQDAYPEPPEVPAQAARRRILAALGESLAAFSEDRPVLLIVDDLQWADELSLDFLRSLDDVFFARRHLLVMGTYRVEEVSDALAEVLRAPAMTCVDLGRLDEASVGAIVGDMLAMPEPPQGFVRVLTRRSSGNPFYVAEYLRAAVAERLLYRERGAWRVAVEEDTEEAYEAQDLPHTLAALVGRRLDGLAKSARTLVEAAAVLGREVDGDLLVAVANMVQGEALSAVKELLSRQVLEEVRPGRFRFVHDKLREIAYDRIPEGRRRALHRSGASAIEARYEGTSAFSLLFSELAYHFTEAGDHDKAIDYLELAGQQAEKSFANREAARFFKEALALDDSAKTRVNPLRRAVWERQLGNAYLGLGKLVESQDALLQAVGLLGHEMPGPLFRLVPSFLGQVGRQVVHRFRQPKWETLAGSDRATLLEAARAYDLLVQASYYVTGDLLRILYATISNLNLAEKAGPSPELALAYGNAHFTAGLIPLFSLARTYGRRAHEILENVSDPAVRSWVYVLAGAYATGVGAWDEAIALGKKGEAIAEEVGFRRRAEEALGVCGAAYNLMGELTLGRDTSYRIYESSLRGDPQTQVWGQSGEAMGCLMLGEYERALTAAERSAECLSQKLGRPEKIFAYGVLAIVRLRSGDPQGAFEAAERGADAIAEGTPISFYSIAAYSFVADVFLDLWEAGSDVADRKTIEQRARRSTSDVVASAKIFPVHRAHALLTKGRVAALSGEAAAAIALWEKSLEAAKELAMPHDEGLAELHLGLARGAQSAAGKKHLQRAARLFRRIGAAPDARRAESALGKA